MTQLNVLIVDDHPIFRKGMRMLLESVPDMEVAGEATTSDAAVELAASLQPDVILMDLHLPDASGLSATRQIFAAYPHMRILVVTMFEDDDSVFAALRAGARGYFLKDANEDEIVRAIRAVAQGEAIFSPAIAARLMDFFAATREQVSQEAFPELTDREREILTLIGQGKSNGDIAEQLTISLKTVRNHVSNIYGKLQVADRAQAAIRARDAGLR